MVIIARPRLRRLLTSLPGWTLRGKAVVKRYTFQNFTEAMAFVNRVADLAEAQAHHPDITIRYNRVTLSLWTHSAGGITQKDLDLARRIEALLAA
jgi:4a-hydroxytetrahydrobiopterin dehydratase